MNQAPTSPTTTGMEVDEIYIKLVSKAGLFGKAFFGHRKTKREARQLNRLWKLAQKIAAANISPPVESDVKEN